MKNRTKVATAIMTHVVNHLRNNPMDSNLQVAKAIESLVNYSYNTIRVAIPLALSMARKENISEESNNFTATDPVNTGTWFEYNDTHYTFNFTDAPSATLERRVVKDMVWLYSNRGGKLSKPSVAARLNDMHGETISTKFLARILTALGVVKTSPPFPPHIKDKYTPLEIDKMRLARIDAEIEIECSRDVEQKWRTMYEKSTQHAARVHALSVEVTKAFAQVPTREVYRASVTQPAGLAVCAAYDVHMGKGPDMSFEEQLSTFTSKAKELASNVLRASKPSKVLTVFGGDYFNVDNAHNQTTSGTPQEMSATPTAMLERGILAACNYVDAMRTVAPVDILVIPGNHDALLTWALYTALKLRYADEPTVTVLENTASRAYYRYGASLMGFEHGDGPKHGDLGMLMAVERRKLWGETTQSYWFVGHLHHVREYETGGAHIFQVPSLSPHDSWHKKKGFCISKQAHRAFLFDEDKGHYATLTV